MAEWLAYDRATRLKCGRCNKWKGETNFSNKQLGNLRIKVAKFGNAATSASDAGLVCRLCTGGQVVEKECAMCGKTKGLEEFAKVQRTRGDDAVSMHTSFCRYAVSAGLIDIDMA